MWYSEGHGLMTHVVIRKGFSTNLHTDLEVCGWKNIILFLDLNIFVI